MFKGERNVLESLLGTVEQHISAQGVRCSIYLNTFFFLISLDHFRWLLNILGPNSWVCNGHESHCNHSRGIFWPWLWPGQQRHRPSHRTDRPNTKVKWIFVVLLVSVPVWSVFERMVYAILFLLDSKEHCGWARNILCPWWSRWPPSLTSWLEPVPILHDYEIL